MNDDVYKKNVSSLRKILQAIEKKMINRWRWTNKLNRLYCKKKKYNAKESLLYS